MQNKMWPKTGLEANFFSFFSGLYSELPKILLLILFSLCCDLTSFCIFFNVHSGLSAPPPTAAAAATTTAAAAATAKPEEVHTKHTSADWPSAGIHTHTHFSLLVLFCFCFLLPPLQWLFLFFVISSQLARIMAVLQQQRQVGGLSSSSKLSPSHHGGGGGPKLPVADPMSHPGLAPSVADLHQKNLGPYSGKQLLFK